MLFPCISFLSKVTQLLIIELEALDVAPTAGKVRLILFKHQAQTLQSISGAQPIK